MWGKFTGVALADCCALMYQLYTLACDLAPTSFLGTRLHVQDPKDAQVYVPRYT